MRLDLGRRSVGRRVPDGAEWNNGNGITVILLIQKCVHVFPSTQR